MSASFSFPQELVSSRAILRVSLLGSPQAVWNDKPIHIPRRFVRALLYRLACELKPVSRGQLTLLFWPDTPETVARRNLSHHLTHLRQALPDPTALITNGDLVWLDGRTVWCDAARLNELLQRPPDDLGDFDELLALYQGPFLDGFDLPGCPEFEQWCLLERNLLERLFLNALESKVERCIHKGEISQAIECAQHYLEIDELSEVMHQWLIRLYAASGDRVTAMRQYEKCTSILDRELGVRPLPETEAIYRAVTHGLDRFPDKVPQAPIPELPGIDVPVFGREDELRRLETALDGLQVNHSQVLLITGEAGIGKSRLLLEFANRHREHIRILYGKGNAGEQVVPYQAILNPLCIMLGIERGSRENGLTSVRTSITPVDYFDPFWLAELSRLVPELRARHPHLPELLPLEPESAQQRLFEALCRLTLTYSTVHGATALCFDDMQWLDATTKAWLVHIARYLKGGSYPILILGTYRSEEADAVAEVRRGLSQSGLLSELRLKGLQETAILQVLRHSIGQRTGDEVLAKRLYEATGGNPFFLIEVLREIIEAGRLEDHLCAAEQIPLPVSVRDAVLIRLQKLNPITRQVLEAGAVLGTSFDLDLLRLTAGRSHAELLDALEELTARVLLVEGEEGYRFIHELTRRTIQDNLGLARRQLLHRRAGWAYQHLKPDAYSALELHFELGADWQKALHYHGLAASKAQALFAWQEVEFHQGRMLELISRIDPQCERVGYVRQRGAILAERAHIRYLQGKLDARDLDLAELAALGEARGDDKIRLQAFLHSVRYLNLDGDYASAISRAEAGLVLASSSPVISRDTALAREARARLLAQIGFARYFLGQPLEALGVLEDALASYGESADPAATGRILHILGYVYFHLGDYTRSLDCQHQAYRCHQEAGDYNRMAWDLIDIGALYKNLGNLTEANRCLEEGLGLARRVGALPAEAYGLTHFGSYDLCLGNYSLAAEHYQQALEMQHVIRSQHIIATAEAGVGLALYHLGDYDHSRAWLERALARARTTGHSRRLAETLIELGMVELADGRPIAARVVLDEGLEVARESQAGECLTAGLALLARLERMTGRPAQALESAQEAMCAAQQIGLTCCEMWGEIESGLACLVLGDLPAALEYTRHALSLADCASQDWIGSEQAYLAYARVLRALGCEREAEEQIRTAESIILAKADHIPDPGQRRQFLTTFQSEIQVDRS